MTQYDPFAYGQVRLGANQGAGTAAGTPAAASPAATATPAATPAAAATAAATATAAAAPEDLLFAGGEAPHKASTADSSWDLLTSDPLPQGGPASLSQAMAFGTEILGEDAPPAPAPTPAPAAPKPAAAKPAAAKPAVAKARPAAEAPPAAAAPTVARPAAAAPAAAATPAAKPAAKPAPKPAPAPAPLPHRKRGVVATAVPAALFAVGGTSALWFWVMQQNVVLAGLVGAVTLVGAAIARVFLRD